MAFKVRIKRAPTTAATLVRRLLAKAPMISLRRVKMRSAMTGAGRAMLSTTWLITKALVELTPSQTTTNAGIIATRRRTKIGMRKPTKPCMKTADEDRNAEADEALHDHLPGHRAD